MHTCGFLPVLPEAALPSPAVKQNASPSIFCGLTIEGLASPSLPGGKEFCIHFYASYHRSDQKSTVFSSSTKLHQLRRLHRRGRRTGSASRQFPPRVFIDAAPPLMVQFF